jgi:hypothetical protein
MKSDGISSWDYCLTVLDEIISFAQNTAYYEAEKEILVSLKKLRATQYFSQSERLGNITKDLNLNKFKYDRLKRRVEQLSAEYRCLIEPVLSELEKKIALLRDERNGNCR